VNKLIYILFSFLLLLIGCEKDTHETPDELTQWPIVMVKGPTSGYINQIITLDVYYPTSSGCDVVTELLSYKHDKTIFIIAYGYTITDSFCTLAAVPKVIEYEFIPEEGGIYTLHFISPDNTKINITIK
jgi:hypothetical protein